MADSSPNPIPGAPGASYVATPNDSRNPTEWTIKAKGAVNGQTGAVEETVTRTQEFQFALFAKDQLIVDGNSSSDWATYSETGGAPNHNGGLDIGTDGELKCTGGGFPSNVTAYYYRANGSSNTYTCGTPVTTEYVFPVPTAPSGSYTCPDSGHLGSGYSAAAATLATGTYVCTAPITINGVLNVSGPVALYVMLPSPLSQSTDAVDIKGGSYINDQYDYCNNNHNTPPAARPLPSRRQRLRAVHQQRRDRRRLEWERLRLRRNPLRSGRRHHRRWLQEQLLRLRNPGLVHLQRGAELQLQLRRRPVQSLRPLGSRHLHPDLAVGRHHPLTYRIPVTNPRAEGAPGRIRPCCAS